MANNTKTSLQTKSGSDVELTYNYADMSINMIYDNCTVVIDTAQRSGLWLSDYLVMLGFKKSVDSFRSTEVGKTVKSAAFKFRRFMDSARFELIENSFDMTSHDYYASIKQSK